MKKLSLLLFTAIACSALLYSQHSFIVQNVTAEAFQTLSEAYGSAENGDTIYLPGGEFAMPTTISKSLVWVGVGHDYDSTEATYFTQLNNNVVFDGSTDGSFITGIRFSGSLQFGQEGDHATDITITRCRVAGTTTFKVGNDTTDINFTITECITGALDGNFSSNCTIENNNIFSYITDFDNTNFDYNNFNDYDNNLRVIRYCKNCLFTNNIFTYHHSLYITTNCYFNNNLFSGIMNFPQGTNEGSGNLTNINWNNFYQVLASYPYNFSYDNNYHLQTSNPAWATFSTDGTEPGIYGGNNPYKEGGVPFNPHVSNLDIDQKTSNGILPVEIKVGAQNR